MLGSYLILTDRLERSRILLWSVFLSFPLPYIATLTGWFTAEVGRQPWVIYGLMRTADAVTPTLTVGETAVSMVIFLSVHTLIFSFGTYYIYRLLHAGPGGTTRDRATNAKRPLALGDPQKQLSVAPPYQHEGAP